MSHRGGGGGSCTDNVFGSLSFWKTQIFDSGFLHSSPTPRAEMLSHRVLHMAVDFHSCKQEQEMHTWSHTNLDWLNTAQQVLRKQVILMRRGPLEPDMDKNQWYGIDPMLRCQLSHWEGATQKMPDSGVKPKYHMNYLGIIIHRPSFSFLLATTFIIFSIRTH